MPGSEAALDTTSLVVGITGHRNLLASEVPALQGRVRDFFLQLQQRYPNLPLTLLSSLAEGSDQLVAQVALDLGLRVVAPLPLPVSLYRDDFESPDKPGDVRTATAASRTARVATAPGQQPRRDRSSRPGPRPAVRPGRHLCFQSLPCAAGAVGWTRVGSLGRHRAELSASICMASCQGASNAVAAPRWHCSDWMRKPWSITSSRPVRTTQMPCTGRTAG